MVLLSMVKPILVYLRLYGIALQTPEMTKGAQWMMIFFSVINLIYLIAAPFLMVHFSSWYNMNFYIEQTLPHIVVYFGILISHTSIILEKLFTREKQFNFWTTLLALERTFPLEERNKIEKANRKLRRKLTQWVFLLGGLTYSCKFILITTNQVFMPDTDWLATEVISLWAQEAIRLNFFTHFIFVEILRLHLEMYNEKTMEVTKMAKICTKKALLCELNFLKIRHSLIWKLNQHLNSFFKWAQTMNCLLYFFDITNLTYWIYNGINIGKIENREQRMIVNLILCITVLAHLVYSCEMLKEATNKTPPLIHEISQHVPNPFDGDVHDDVMAIAMQIHHERIFITYGGFFNVDMSLITAISGTIATYLVIFIQFIG
uniref:Gustatory receptor n=1 Tax=Lutzomyia longipalpis TaxID=7200 RepID=A0A3F2ZDH4_LUTLO